MKFSCDKGFKDILQKMRRLATASNTLLPKIRIQYVSDLHLEWNRVAPENLVKPVAPYLALAGDIAPPTHPSLRPFLAFASAAFERVFYVPGNHEYDGFSKKGDCDAALAAACAEFPNVSLLNRSVFRFPDKNVAVVGAPLWSPAFTFMGRRDLTAEIHVASAEDRAFFAAQIRHFVTRGTQIVALSHFMPSESLVLEKYAKYPNKHRFYHPCDDMIRAPVRAWIYGHSHSAARHFINRVGCVINPYGHPREQRTSNGYCDRIFVEFPLQTHAEEDAPPPRPYNIFRI